MTRDELLKIIKKAARHKQTELDLSGEEIKELPPEIGQLAGLTKLNVQSNQLTSLPPEIGQLTSLKTLTLSSNKLRSLPPEIGEFTCLTDLDLSANELTSVPPEIGRLTNLTHLSVYMNKLTSLSPEIGKLTNLASLMLFGNKLTSLPPEIGQLANLDAFFVHSNRLSSLPSEIGQLDCLTSFTICGNNLSSLPQEVGQLTQLRSVYVGHPGLSNPLTTLPPELGRLTNIENLHLDELELTDPPPDVVGQGTKAVLAYLREKLEQETQIWESRLMVVGEGGVGKTQLLRALNGEDFQVDSETTHGIGVIPLKLPHPTEDDVTMTLNAWDFGGQEIYHATHQFFLASRSLFLLAWNARLGWEQGKLHYWLDTIKALAPGAPIMLVATHIDEREPTLPFDNLQKKYPQIIGKCSVSSDKRKLGDGIEGLRERLQGVAADNETMPLMGKTAPTSFWSTIQAVRKLKKKEKWITVDRLWEIMAENNVSEAARPVLAQQLHDLGEVLHFNDDDELKDSVLLDAAWVTKNISDVLEFDGIEVGVGVFTRDHMKECWSDLNRQLQDRFLHLMERFDLSYEIPDDKQARSLVVERLSLDPVPFENEWNKKHPDKGFREICMKFDPQSTRPAGIPGWFIARSHRFTTHTHWKYGALFQDNRKLPRHLALLESSSQYRYVQLTVRGPSPQNFFAVLRDGLEHTFDRFPGLVLKRTMPCPETLDDGRACPFEFDLAHLEKRIQRKRPIEMIECPECLNQVSVLGLLYGLNWTMKDRVLERLDKLDEAGEERTQRVLDEIGDLRALTQRQFLTLFNAEQKLEESHCPRVFSMRPANGKKWPVVGKLVGTKWQLQLYCEAPGCWHPAEQGKKQGLYPIAQPGKWLSTVAPWMKGLITVLKYGAHFAGPVAGYAAPALEKLLKSDIALMKALIEKLPGVTSGRDPKEEYGLEEGDKSRVGGASLRSLRRLLTELDPKQEWGGLKKTLTPEGHWLWLCKEHAEAYLQ